MRSYNNLYEPMLQDDYIKQCFINASKKKKNRNDVREVLENLDEHTELLKKMLTEELFIPDYHKPSMVRLSQHMEMWEDGKLEINIYNLVTTLLHYTVTGE